MSATPTISSNSTPSGLESEMNPELIEKHRDINVDHDWWDCTYDHFMEDMKQVGITVKDMRFSGFWSQGDGASFTGYSVCRTR